MIKVSTSSVNSSSTLSSCSMRAMYNIVHRDQKQSLMLKIYLSWINTSIFQKRYYKNIFSRKLVNELHVWVENHPLVIHSPNLKYSLFSKTNGTLFNKHNHLLQISVRHLHNHMISPISEEGFFW